MDSYEQLLEDEYQKLPAEQRAKIEADRKAQEEQPEAGLEEGDLSDYVSPLGAVRGAARKAVEEGVVQGGKALAKAGAPRVLNYAKQKIGFGPTKTETAATTGFGKPSTGLSPAGNQKAMDTKKLLELLKQKKLDELAGE